VARASVERSAQVLTCLARHTRTGVRGAVAANHATPSEIIEELACDLDDDVRASVAAHWRPRPDFEPDSIEEYRYGRLPGLLASDEVANVRRALAGNAYAPVDILARLAADLDPTVARAATR
jgi:hypothetical protein